MKSQTLPATEKLPATENLGANSDTTNAIGLRSRLSDFQHGLVDRTWRASLILAALGLSNNVYQILTLGWKNSFAVNIVVASLVIVVNIYLARIPVKTKIFGILFFYALLGFGNLPNGGMFGAGWYWFVIISLLCAVFFSIRTGIIALTLFGVLLAGICYGYVSYGITSNFDLNVRSHDLGSWINFFTVVIVESAVLLFAIGGYLKAIQDLLTEVQTQKDLAEEARERAEVAQAETAKALDELSKSQEKLIQSEKLAALGSLVAGVAHELNTPIGNALVMSSTLKDQSEAFAETMKDGVKRSALEQYIKTCIDGNSLLMKSLTRAAELVSSFKQIAVDQTSSQRREFDLHDVCRESIIALTMPLKQVPYTMTNDIPEGIRMDSYPGPLSQIMINSIQNALTHAFDGRETGSMTFLVENQTPESITLIFKDDGVGMTEDVAKRAFEPFFTTKLGTGGNGLGLHIVHNIATGLLGGSIQIKTAVGKGTEFHFHLPLVAPQ